MSFDHTRKKTTRQRGGPTSPIIHMLYVGTARVLKRKESKREKLLLSCF